MKKIKNGKIVDITQEELNVHLNSLIQTPEEINAIEIEENNISNIKNDVLLSAIENNSMSEIETWVSGQFSALVNMSDTDIDNYVDTNITDLASSKEVLKILAKDVSKAISILKVVTKVSKHLIKKSLT